MKVTIRDVAREAGVSVATVSRVLNDSGPVRDTTRRRIVEVATALRYTPDSAARSLITRKTNTLGVLLPDLYGEFFSEVIRGIDQTARQRGFHLLVSSSHNDRSQMETALRAMRGRVDGLVVMSPHIDGAGIAAILPESLPVVLLNCTPPEESCASDGAAGVTQFDSFGIDNLGGAAAMVRHFVAHGHRRIAIITGPAHNSDAEERLCGYRDALAEEL